MPFLLEPSLPANWDGVKSPGEASLLGGELALPFRVARVSRLIGNFDTTANGCGWQANSAATGFPRRRTQSQSEGSCPSQTQETPLSSEWRSALPRQSLAPNSTRGRWLLPPCLLETSPAGLPPLEGRFVSVALAGRLLFLGLAGVSLAAGTSLAFVCKLM